MCPNLPLPITNHSPIFMIPTKFEGGIEQFCSSTSHGDVGCMPSREELVVGITPSCCRCCCHHHCTKNASTTALMQSSFPSLLHVVLFAEASIAVILIFDRSQSQWPRHSTPTPHYKLSRYCKGGTSQFKMENETKPDLLN